MSRRILLAVAILLVLWNDAIAQEVCFEPTAAGALTARDFLVLIVAGLAWIALWRALKRGILGRAFCYWFPTAMLLLIFVVGSALTALDPEENHGTVWEFSTALLVGINFPVLAATATAGLVGAPFPLFASDLINCLLFWLTWHAVLRFLKWRIRVDAPIAINLSD